MEGHITFLTLYILYGIIQISLKCQDKIKCSCACLVAFGEIIPNVLFDAPCESRVTFLHSVLLLQLLQDRQNLTAGWTFLAGDSQCGGVMLPHELHKRLCFSQVLVAYFG